MSVDDGPTTAPGEKRPSSSPRSDPEKLVDAEYKEFVHDDQWTTELDKRIKRKMDWRIIPLSAFIYLLCSLDRSNIGNAKIMNKEKGHDLLTQVHMTNYEYTIALMMFYLAYALFEVPSNIFLKRMRPSRWIAILMISWGSCTIGLGGVHSYASLTIVRFLLGVFEAGLFPGLVYYLTFWYRPEERSMRVSLILASATLAGAFGGAIAYGIARMDNVSGLSAWRWLFILEGIPSVALAPVIAFLLPDYPESARWLTVEERARAEERLRGSGSSSTSDGLKWEDIQATVLSPRLWVHYIAYFGVSPPFSSLSLFSPTIVAGLGYTSLRAQLFTVPPYAVAYVVQVCTSYLADRLNRRGLVTMIMATIGAIGFITEACLPVDDYMSRYGALILAASGSFASIPPLLGWLTSNTRTTSGTGLAVAMNISTGAPGQILGVWIYKASEAQRGFPTGHWTNAGLLLMVACICLGLHLWYVRMNRKILQAGKGERLYKL
ncbi:major facilitator superfamily domain-containing protein [Auriculariales sp. MPI-PUGE-AT-0066]|nr:major facilitator superfamily domain-containing protein [Auriculariales sp. MPI-PUGE-AT-0066]